MNPKREGKKNYCKYGISVLLIFTFVRLSHQIQKINFYLFINVLINGFLSLFTNQ